MKTQNLYRFDTFDELHALVDKYGDDFFSYIPCSPCGYLVDKYSSGPQLCIWRAATYQTRESDTVITFEEAMSNTSKVINVVDHNTLSIQGIRVNIDDVLDVLKERLAQQRAQSTIPAITGELDSLAEAAKNSPQEAYVIKYKGQALTLSSGKSLWKKMSHAKAALLNHFTKIEMAYMYHPNGELGFIVKGAQERKEEFRKQLYAAIEIEELTQHGKRTHD